MLASQRTQFEQPRLRVLQRGRVMDQRIGGGLQLVLGLARFDYRAVQRCQRIGQQRMLTAYPVQPARGRPQQCQWRVRPIPDYAQLLQIARQLLALLHVGAHGRQLRFFACFGGQRSQFGKMRQQQVLVVLRLCNGVLRLGQRFARVAPCRPCIGNRRAIRPGIAIKQPPVPVRIDKPAIIMLPVQLHQHTGHFAQQRHADRLVIHKCLGPAIRLELTADQQRLTRFRLDVGVVQYGGEHGRRYGKFERSSNARLVRASAHQSAIGAIAQHEPQRIQQDGFTRASLTRKYAQPTCKIQVERLDQHDVPDGKMGQHNGRPPLSHRPARVTPGDDTTPA